MAQEEDRAAEDHRHEYGSDIELVLVPHLDVLKTRGLRASHAQGIFDWIVSSSWAIPARRQCFRTSG